MNVPPDSLLALFERVKRKAPEYIDLLTARTDDEFERAFEAILEKAVMRLEADSKNFSDLGEDGLSSVLAASLSIPGLSVTRESNSNGHVDLTIDADHCMPARRKLGEAKIYDGPAYHFKGLTQLLNRYSTGREGPGLIIVYFKKGRIAELVQRVREAMDQTRPSEQQGATSNHQLKWSFRSQHLHSCGDVVGVSHIGCNLCSE